MLNADRRFVIAELNIFNPVNPAGNLSRRNLDVADIARSHVKMLAQALNTVIEPGSIWGGVPAKFIKKVDPEQAKELNQKIAHNYLMYSDWYK